MKLTNLSKLTKTKITVFLLSLLISVFSSFSVYASNINLYYDNLPNYDNSKFSYFVILYGDVLICSNNPFKASLSDIQLYTSNSECMAFKFDKSSNEWIEQTVLNSYDYQVYFSNSSILSFEDDLTVYDTSDNVNLIIGDNPYEALITQTDYDDTVVNRLDLIYTLLLYFFAFCIVGFVCFLLYRSVASFITF